MITLREILKMPCLTRAQVIAGASGLDRQVSSVTVTDVPDFFQWLRGNEFILTTGFAFQGNAESLVQSIPFLKEANVSGLGIKFNRYLTQLPDSVGKLADELGVPIISIPYECSWTDIINPIMTEIINMQAAQLERSDYIRKQLIEQVLGHGGLREIARLLGEYVENPVAIIDLASNHLFSHSKMPTLPDSNLVSGLCLPGKDETSTVIQDIPRISHIQGTNPRVVIPIEARQTKNGYIVMLEQNRPFCPEDVIPLEQATIVAALEIEKMEAHRKAKRNLRHNLLRQIFEDDSFSYLVAKMSFQEVGWELGEHYVVSAVDITMKESNSPQQSISAIWEVKEYILRNCTRLFSSNVIGGLDGRQRFIFLQPVNPETCTKAEIEKGTKELKTGLARLLEDMAQETILDIGTGRFHKGYKGIQTAYKEAVQALQIGSQIFGQNRITHFSDLGLYRIFHHEAIRNELELFFLEMLDPLISNKNDHKDLLETLRVFLETGGNYRLTAKKLFLHHNTVRYRIESVEKLCKVDLKNENDRLHLAISLKLIPLFRYI
ncbi:PucR family transcriptional regulator [Peribacillus kribbensis]|uniref:PucR family transcriptional regulator n=1 Tax=Peribacillus kribbensis TaxID=356658 RepID=UPI0004146C1A|nr:PucR family transcriptional regulator [Peribacillus kribbensis]